MSSTPRTSADASAPSPARSASCFAAARARGCRVLLFVDQFEELYTLAGDDELRRAYLACLLGAADDPMAPVRVVVSMRSDFLDRAAADQAFLEALPPA